ncbi:hypothetical protein [Rhodanobacter sp. C05]|uniref:hypothetical protein n=1 Tax=Rhodanobacter sp. C05 TaxID=1945855 RepID=UPI000984BBD0|nr:hypothetical protein [Rhodanobacter sp. C05]OOG37511.1 hypothetical protein B0E51_16840 [Rhodanobacter sp. C05]
MKRLLLCFVGVLAGAVVVGLTTPWNTVAGATQAVAATHMPAPANLNWALQLPTEGKVIYRGVADFNSAGMRQSAMLYPAPNAIGMLVAVATHAALMKSGRNAQKEKIQAAADKVLDPYLAVLADFNYRELMQSGLSFTTAGAAKQLVEAGKKHDDIWLVLSTAVFSMTQDQSTIVLDNMVTIYAPGESKKAAYSNTIRVIADAQVGPNLAAVWTANQGAALKDESAHLLATSLDIAFSDASTTSGDLVYKTIRYMEGSAERMERGQLLSEHCGRVLLRSLRGSLMSVPVRVDAMASPADCTGTGDAMGDLHTEPQQSMTKSLE